MQVSDVKSGLKCGCICPACLGKLQANKGTKRTHYFSHDPLSNSDECKSAFETTIHLMAKQILEKNKNAIFPSLELSMSMKDDGGILHTEKIEVTAKTKKDFINVVLEKRLEDIRPDIIAYTSSKTPILIEVAVTNFSSVEKMKKIRNLGLYAIEIDLSGISCSILESELTELVIGEFKNKKWLSNPDAVNAKIELREKLKKKIDEANRHIMMWRQACYEKPHVKSIKEPNILLTQKKLSITSKQYDQRWFRCEACRHHFLKSVLDAPYTLNTIECPECGYPVRTVVA